MSVSPRDCELLGHRDQVPNHLTTLSVWAHLTLKHPSKVETHINFTFQIVKGKLREVYLRNLISERQSQDAQHLKQCLAKLGVQWIFIRKNQHLHFSCIRPWWCSQLEGMNTLCSCFLYSNYICKVSPPLFFSLLLSKLQAKNDPAVAGKRNTNDKPIFKGGLGVGHDTFLGESGCWTEAAFKDFRCSFQNGQSNLFTSAQITEFVTKTPFPI